VNGNRLAVSVTEPAGAVPAPATVYGLLNAA
jgi:hypothetical protein